MSEKRLPTTLVEAVRYFADPDVAVDFVAKLRWPEGQPVCPACEGTEHSYLKTRRLWKCKACKKQFSVKQGTIFEDSAIPLDKWLAAIWLIANAKNGISSYELARSVGMTQKSAWFVLHRIRLAMECRSFEKFDGEVEADETWVGGRVPNMHESARKRRGIGVGPDAGKTVVAGSLERGTEGTTSRVTARVIEKNASSIRAHVRESVQEGAALYTDKHSAYTVLGREYSHESVDHGGEWVRGAVHTNGIENFWALFKRGIKGTYIHVDPDHMDRYLAERTFTFNERWRSDLGRFVAVLEGIADRRLTYSELVG